MDPFQIGPRIGNGHNLIFTFALTTAVDFDLCFSPRELVTCKKSIIVDISTLFNKENKKLTTKIYYFEFQTEF